MSHSHDIFLDHAATTPLHPEAMGAMLPFFGFHFGLPSQESGLGIRSRDAVNRAREAAALLVNAEDHEIIFTSGGTESNNLAIQGAAGNPSGGHIITSDLEHVSVLQACRKMERQGCRITVIPAAGQGLVDPRAVEQAVSDDTVLISIMHACHTTGTIQPVEEIGAMARGRGILFHVDAAQSAGRIPVDVKALNADLLTVSSHKIYGPKGTGALFVRDGTDMAPLFCGGHEERGIRPGAVNVPGIVGFGIAAAAASRDIGESSIKVKSLRESFEQQILGKIAGAKIHASDAQRLPHITLLSIEGIPGRVLAARLSIMGIIVSPVPAPGELSGAVRLSFGWENTDKEIRRVVKNIEQAVDNLRE